MPVSAWGAAIAALGVWVATADGPGSFLRDGFEGDKTTWRREETDATIGVDAHERSDRAAHEGRRSERVAFRAGPGSVLYYSYDLPTKVPVTGETKASVFVRANRPGAKLFARVVLPEDLDPDTGRPAFLLVPGEGLEDADKWVRLDMGNLGLALERQARVLRVGSGRKVSLEGAYIDRVVLNLYGGPGENEVFLDELAAGPLPADDAEAGPDAPEEADLAPLPDAPTRVEAPDAGRPSLPARREKATSGGRVRITAGNQILLDGKDWVPTILDAPGADPLIAKQHGFDVWKLEPDAPPRIAEAAVGAQLLLAPSFAIGAATDPAEVVNAMRRFPLPEHVAFWSLGDALGASDKLGERKDQLDRARKVLAELSEFPPEAPKLAMATVTDFLPQYSLAGNGLDVVGIAPGDWGTIRDPKESYRFLRQRRDLVAGKNPNQPFLAWVEASAPPSATRAVWGAAHAPEWGRPQVQPEQIRMQTYAALSAGYRAIGFRAGPDITSPAGMSRLIEMAFLNFEIDLLQPMIARGADPIVFNPCFDKDPDIPLVFNPLGAAAGASQQKMTSPKAMKEVAPHPSISAASIPIMNGRGKLLLVCDYAAGSQYQPPQMGKNDLKVLIQSPGENAQGFEITPAGVTVLVKERTTGGTKFTLPVFSGTALILVTTDLAIKAELERKIAAIAPMATEMAIRQARFELAQTAEINARIVRYGHPVRDSDDLLDQATELLKNAEEVRQREDYESAWQLARRAGRALRVLRRSHWNKAFETMARMTRLLAKNEETKFPYTLIYGIASPPLTAWQTLPQHYLWMDEIAERNAMFGENLLSSGNFEVDGIRGLAEAGWTDVSHPSDTLQTRYEIIDGAGYRGTGRANSALRMVVAPKSDSQKVVDKLSPYIDHPAVAIKSPPIPVFKNCLVRIRVLYRTSQWAPEGTGGLIIEDSLGGPSYRYARQFVNPLWREVVLYRKAPEDGTMTVTLGLACFGEAYFDRVRVDTLTAPSGETEDRPRPAAPVPMARRPTPPAANLPGREETGPRR